MKPTRQSTWGQFAIAPPKGKADRSAGSWWIEPMTRQQFSDRAAKEAARMNTSSTNYAPKEYSS